MSPIGQLNVQQSSVFDAPYFCHTSEVAPVSNLLGPAADNHEASQPFVASPMSYNRAHQAVSHCEAMYVSSLLLVRSYNRFVPHTSAPAVSEPLNQQGT